MSTFSIDVRINAGGIALKKHYIVPFFLAILLIISGCAKEVKEDTKPEAIADQFLIALQTNDVATIQVLSDWDTDSISALQLKDEDLLLELDKELQEEVHDVLFAFDYEIKETNITDKKANITLSITQKDIHASLAKSLSEAKKKLKKAYEKEKFPDADAIVFSTIYKAIANTKTTQTNIVTLTLNKHDHTWIVSDQNQPFKDLLLQNSKEFINQLQ